MLYELKVGYQVWKYYCYSHYLYIGYDVVKKLWKYYNYKPSEAYKEWVIIEDDIPIEKVFVIENEEENDYV